MKRVMLCLFALVFAGNLVGGNLMTNPIPVMAASVTFVPAQVVCPCGGEKTVEVTISGKADEFGPQGDQTYTLRLMESDIITDDCLINVYGKYPAFVAANDPVAFRIVFRLKCSANCLTVTGVGVDKLEISIKGGAWQQQQEFTGAGDTFGLLDLPPEGQYDVETGSDTDDGGELELTMEFYLSNSNVGDGEFDCLLVGGVAEFPQIEEPGTAIPDYSSEHNYGPLAGIIVGAIVGTIILISAVWYIRRRRTKAI